MTSSVFLVCGFTSQYRAFSEFNSKTCLKRPLKNRQSKGLNDKRYMYLNEGRKYYRMVPFEHSAIL